ncbi:MAG: hypothetical protein ACOVRJ_22495 [Roseateles sp.]
MVNSKQTEVPGCVALKDQGKEAAKSLLSQQGDATICPQQPALLDRVAIAMS